MTDKPFKFHPSLSDNVVQMAIEDAEKQIAYYKARLKAAKAEMRRRKKEQPNGTTNKANVENSP